MMQRTLVRVLASAALLSVVACNNDPAKDKSRAQVGEAVATTQGAQAGAVTYKFSSPTSKLGYVGAKITRKHEGTFETMSGTIAMPPGDPSKAVLKAEVDVASLTADDPKLAGHLKSADFFDVEKFPKARFTSTSIKAGGEKGATHTITGNLELRGVTKSIAFPATVKAEGDRVDADAEFAINRKDFGIVYPGKPDDLIKDEVLLRLTIRATKG